MSLLQWDMNFTTYVHALNVCFVPLTQNFDPSILLAQSLADVNVLPSIFFRVADICAEENVVYMGIVDNNSSKARYVLICE